MPNNCPLPNENRPFFLHRPWLTTLSIAGGLILFGLTLYGVLTHSLLFAFDPPVSDWFAALAKTRLAGFETIFTWFANLSSILPNVVCLVFAYHFLRQKCDDRFTLLLASYGVGTLAFFLLALGINRERPALPGLLASLPFPSYPSGHMIQTLTILLPLLYLYLPRVTPAPRRGVILLVGLIYLAAVALDRLVVNAHYLTDILGGLGIGTAWPIFAMWLFERSHLRLMAGK